MGVRRIWGRLTGIIVQLVAAVAAGRAVRSVGVGCAGRQTAQVHRRRARGHQGALRVALTALVPPCCRVAGEVQCGGVRADVGRGERGAALREGFSGKEGRQRREDRGENENKEPRRK